MHANPLALEAYTRSRLGSNPSHVSGRFARAPVNELKGRRLVRRALQVLPHVCIGHVRQLSGVSLRRGDARGTESASETRRQEGTESEGQRRVLRLAKASKETGKSMRSRRRTQRTAARGDPWTCSAEPLRTRRQETASPKGPQPSSSQTPADRRPYEGHAQTTIGRATDTRGKKRGVSRAQRGPASPCTLQAAHARPCSSVCVCVCIEVWGL